MKRLLGVLLIFSLLIGLNTASWTAASPAGTKQVLRIGLEKLPASLDPAISSDVITSTIVNGLFEGLVRLDKTGQAVPGIAKAWTISSDGKTYTFTLRSDAKWSNKERITAADFEYAWKRALAPETGSISAFNMYTISNAKDYNQGRLKDSSKVGVKALNSNTLQVTLNEKTAYFIQSLAENVYLPVNAGNVKANKKWAYSANTIITNGPFTLQSWEKNKMTLVSNPKYHAAADIHFSEVQFLRPKPGTANTTAAYINNEADWVVAEFDKLDNSTLAKTSSIRTVEMPLGSTYYYQFNLQQAPFNNVNIRKALAMAIDREALRYGSPAFGFIPPAIRSTDLNFRTAVADTSYFKENVKLAKELLQKGLNEEGLNEFPSFSVIVNEGPGHYTIAESIINDWYNNLGIKASLEVQSWEELISNKVSRNFAVVRAGWGADYNDPSAMMEILSSTNENNDSGWSDPLYDSYVTQAKHTFDPKERINLYAKAEKLLIDQMAIIPLYYYVADVLQKPNIHNVYLDYDGNIAFTRGYIK
ncbi:peptide ABC transporter substrate-binding protein [Paenibacillus sp. FSL H7-0357]|uniref:peptide ABC transporter substrate-binding protein n=1 Tax=Paenibacillus sp. FSL H7-0357 TaxID=1536774 RepID=UPI000689E1C1|nr:peptide ABC transporter substrate-binding protein [Paenibacillus sp. FSL H7-0357]